MYHIEWNAYRIATDIFHNRYTITIALVNLKPGPSLTVADFIYLVQTWQASFTNTKPEKALILRNVFLNLIQRFMKNPTINTFVRSITNAINKKRTVGAVAPSSRFLCDKILSDIDFSKDLVLIEYGPGTGIFTDEIIRRMSDNSILYIFELDKTFYDKLVARISDPRVKIFQESAENAEHCLRQDNIQFSDCIISSLPLAVIPKKTKRDIIEVSKRILGETGKYVQFQYSLHDKKLLLNYFSEMNIGFTALNIPPAFVYYCNNSELNT